MPRSNVIKFDVSGQDPSESSSNFAEPPQPGVYHVKLVEVKPGYPRNDENRERPRLEIVAEVCKAKGAKSKHNGARLWDYIGFAENQAWKLDQFLQAVGVATSKKRSGSFDPDKLVGKTVQVRVAADTYEGQYTARLKSYLLDVQSEDEDDDLDEDDDFDIDDDYDDDHGEDDEEDEEEAEEVEEEDEGVLDDDDDDEFDDDDDEGPVSMSELKGMDLAELKALGKSYGMKRFPKAKAALVKAVSEAQDDYFEEDPFEDED